MGDVPLFFHQVEFPEAKSLASCTPTETLSAQKVIRPRWIGKSPFIPILVALACQIPSFC